MFQKINGGEFSILVTPWTTQHSNGNISSPDGKLHVSPYEHSARFEALWCLKFWRGHEIDGDAHFFELSVRDIQSRPSYKPSPVVAQADWMYHWRVRMLFKPSFSVTSLAAMEFGKSCLFAKTST